MGHVDMLGVKPKKGGFVAVDCDVFLFRQNISTLLAHEHRCIDSTLGVEYLLPQQRIGGK